MKEFDKELVSGSIFRSVWKLVWPVILLQIVSGLHGFIDQILVGRYVGYHANAGIGVAWQLFLVMIVFIASLFHGMGVVIARYSGREDREAVSKVAFETFKMAFIVLVFFSAPVGFVISPYLLALTNASPEVQQHALPYLRILFTSSAPLFMMFMLNGAFQTTGDPRTPLALGVLTTLVNIVLSYLLITGAGPFPELGAVGAAIGTCLGPVPSVGIALWLILTNKSIIQAPKKFTLLPDFSVLKVVLRIGLPSGIQGVLLNVGGVILLGFIGSLEQSAEAQAAYTICYAQLFTFVTFMGFGLRAATSTIMGQNIGAGDPERGKRGVYVAMGLGVIWAAGFGVIYWNFPSFLLGLFSANHEAVLEIGTTLLRFLTFSGLFIAATLALTGGLQGAGDTKRPMYIAFVSQIVVLIGLCYLLSSMGLLTTTAIWACILTSHVCRFILTCYAFLQGKWIQINVDIGS